MKLTKKGFSLSEVPQLVIVFLVVAIILGIAATVLTEVRTTQVAASVNDLKSVDKTATNVSAVEYNGDYNTLGCSSVKVYNGTNAKEVTSEFTLTSAVRSCTLRITGGNATIQGKTVEINYTKAREPYTTAYNVSSDGLSSQTSLSNWQSTWIVIVSASVILGLIYKYMLAP